MSQEIEATTTLNWSKDGKAHVPLSVRKSLGFENEGEVEVYCVPKVVLLINRKTKHEDVLAGIEVLRRSLLLSWGIHEPRQKLGE